MRSLVWLCWIVGSWCVCHGRPHPKCRKGTKGFAVDLLVHSLQLTSALDIAQWTCELQLVLLQVFDAHEEARYRFARDYEATIWGRVGGCDWSLTRLVPAWYRRRFLFGWKAERNALYVDSVFCLAMPGDGLLLHACELHQVAVASCSSKAASGILTCGTSLDLCQCFRPMATFAILSI